MNRRTAIRSFALAGAAGALPLAAGSHPSYKEDFLNRWKTLGESLEEFIDAMPDEKFNFKPVEEVNTYAEQITHIAGGNSFFISSATGQKIEIEEPEQKDKASVKEHFQALHKACAEAIGELSEEELTEEREPPFPDAPFKIVRDLLLGAFAHTVHHRGQMVVYLRLNGVKPPQFRV